MIELYFRCKFNKLAYIRVWEYNIPDLSLFGYTSGLQCWGHQYGKNELKNHP